MPARSRRPHTRLGFVAIAALMIAGSPAWAGPASGAAPRAATPPHEPATTVGVTLSGTLTYIKGHNVWVSAPDGTWARRVTTSGTAAVPWYSPTESDDGHIVAGRGSLIHRMDQWGTVLTTLDPPDLRSGGGLTLGGALTGGIAVSPNGAMIAYSYAKTYCSVSSNVCRTWPVTGFTSATRLSRWQDFGASYGQTPSWVTNARVALDARTGFDNLYLYEPGRGQVSSSWFDDANLHTDDLDLFDLEVSRGTSYGVAVRGTFDQARIAFYDFSAVGNFRTGIPTPEVVELCQTTPVTGIGSPTFSADGGVAAWHEPDGVWTVAMGSAPCATEPLLTVPGGSAPALSRAALQTTRPTYPARRFVVRAAPKVSGKAAVGRTLRVQPGSFSPAPTSTRYQWLRGRSVIKGASGPSYRVSRKDRGQRLRVRVTIARAGYLATVVTTKAVAVRR